MKNETAQNVPGHAVPPEAAQKMREAMKDLLRGSPAKEPSTLELAANFAAAVSRWSSAGFPTVSGATYAARSDACDACPNWDAKARAGLGKCAVCGCTSLKRWLATEKCPHPGGSRWPA